MSASDSTAMKLRTLMGDHPSTRAMKDGAIASPRVAFEFADVKVPNRAFKQVVRENAFDVAELAIMAYLQARELGKPLVLLPATIVGRHQHGYLVYNPARGDLAPSNLAGRRVGVRSYPVTTATWVRGILAHDHGLDLDRVRWVTFEEPHLAEYREPPTAERAPPGKASPRDAPGGRARCGGGRRAACRPIRRLRRSFPIPMRRARDWCRRNKAVPINHLAVVKQSLAESRPEIVREVYRLLREAKEKVPVPADGIDMLPFGVEALRPSLAIAIEYAFEQGLLAKRLEVDELFDDVTRAL
ncbi:MAG: hypothetical protein HC807_06235 [Gammaproteobacteria bacterium]|nr:hypothetical protein [Gammaproteobacteria bacterium]